MHRLLLGFLALIATGSSCSGDAKEHTATVPAYHRQAGSFCPADRGAGVSDIGTCAQSAVVQIACAKDEDCTAGTNGRCLQGGGPACNYWCSYDECSNDSECPGNAPCACRSSAAASAANTCATAGDCHIDADCGPRGYCSPSQVGSVCACWSESACQPGEGSCYVNGVQVPCVCSGSCGHGYFCHTSKDSCVDDTDCTDGTCNFDLPSGSWMCALCAPPL
jgi:hypothetical protein